MNLNDALACLEAKWRNYVEERGHYIYKTGGDLSVVRSRNANKVRYCWLLLVGHCPDRLLSRSEHADIRYHLRQAKQKKEKVYLVVGFVHEPRRIVVLPADAALKAGRVHSDKGGIYWDC